MRGFKRCWAALGIALAVGACDDKEKPTLCVEPVTADACLNAGEADAGAAPLIPAGEAYRIVHRMPDGIQVDRDVEISIHTPCDTDVESHRHVDGVVELVRVAPPGAECALDVDAVILNSELRASAVGGQCADIDRICGDAGVGDGDTTGPVASRCVSRTSPTTTRR